MQAYKKGRDVLLVYNDNIGDALFQAYEQTYDDEAIILAKAAKIVSQEMFDTKSIFTGTFNDQCQRESVPQSLMTLVAMLLGGSNIEKEMKNTIDAQASLNV